MVKGGLASQQRVHHHAEAPEICFLIVRCCVDNLWCDVTGCSTNCCCELVTLQLLGHPEIDDFNLGDSQVTRCEQDIIKLDVSMDDLKFVAVDYGVK